MIVVPLLLLIGFYNLEQPVLRILCLIGATGWMSIYVVLAITNADWNMLIFPGIFGIMWMILHPLMKDE